MHLQTQASNRQNTRERLLAASLQAFGQRDYDAVSTREIVNSAGTNISAISYHFGGKRQLYLDTADYLADQIRSGIDPVLARIEQRVKAADAEECRILLQQLIRGLVDNLLLKEISRNAAGFIFREQNHPTEAFDILFDKLMLPLHKTYAALVSKIVGTTPKRQEIMLLTHALIGQIHVFRFGQTMILRRLGKQTFTPRDVKRIGELITNLTLAALQAPSLHR